MKTAAANRKATQEAYEKILNAKQVFVPEENPLLQRKASDGTDIWKTMFSKYEEPKKPDFPPASIGVPQVCVEKLKLLGFQQPVLFGELLGWRHETLGWRVNSIYTHNGDDDLVFDEIFPTVSGSDTFIRLGFVRCGGDGPDLTDLDKKKLRSMADKHPVIAMIISYPASHLGLITFCYCALTRPFCVYQGNSLIHHEFFTG